ARVRGAGRAVIRHLCGLRGLRGSRLTRRRGASGSRGDAENAEVLLRGPGRGRGRGGVLLVLTRCRDFAACFRNLVMVWFAPDEPAFAAWSCPRPAPSAAG